MELQKQIDLFDSKYLPVHSGEKDKEVNEFYQSKKERFGKQAKEVLELLLNGIVLTQRGAMEEHSIYSLSTRVSECNKYLLDFNIQIIKGWTEKNDHNKCVRTYYLTPSQIEEYKNRL